MSRFTEFKYWQITRRKENIIRWIAWHLPRTLVMWCYMRVAAHATTGKYDTTDVATLGMMDAIKRWDEVSHD